MAKLKEGWKSVRVKLFTTLCVVIVLIILLLVLINSLVLEKFYVYSKRNTVKKVYDEISEFYTDLNQLETSQNEEFEKKIKLAALKNNLEILIKNEDNVTVVTTNIEQLESLGKVNISNEFKKIDKDSETLSKEDDFIIKKVKEDRNNMTYITLFSTLDNGYKVYIRTPISTIQESVKVSNNVLIIIGGIAIIVSGIVASIISRKFTKPILELNEIAEGMSKLDFSKKYRITDTEDEINNLGKSINTMSDKLEDTIEELKKYNSELAKDIEKKSRIDEMRKQFISDVSHELKTPIALIQGYAEGLIEDVNTDDESRKYYSEVILDEANKMDLLVKQLLELMKLEYNGRILNNQQLDIVSLIKEVIRKCNIMIKENKIEVQFEYKEPIYVSADEFYIEQVISNYMTNAIKYSKAKNGKREILIKVGEHNEKIRVSVFNTGDNISEENIMKIWGRFYKIDTSRNRESGGTGIGLAYVKAVMNNYQNEYGALNKQNGIEFYFDCDKI